MNQRQQRPTRAARRRQAARQRMTLAALVVAVVIAAFTVILRTSANDNGDPADSAETVLAVAPETAAAPYITEMVPLNQPASPAPAEPTAEPEPSEPAPFLSDEIPLSYELQEFMQAECLRWGCPYALALAVVEVESHFNMDAIGAVGEVGIMQLNPGPGGAYHEELEATTGLDPTTPEGNISGGVYLLGSFMTAYDDPIKAVMAYNMGQSGAIKAWAAGTTTTIHAEKVMEAMIRWGHVLANLAEEAASSE